MCSRVLTLALTSRSTFSLSCVQLGCNAGLSAGVRSSQGVLESDFGLGDPLVEKSLKG